MITGKIFKLWTNKCNHVFQLKEETLCKGIKKEVFVCKNCNKKKRRYSF